MKNETKRAVTRVATFVGRWSSIAGAEYAALKAADIILPRWMPKAIRSTLTCIAGLAAGFVTHDVVSGKKPGAMLGASLDIASDICGNVKHHLGRNFENDCDGEEE